MTKFTVLLLFTTSIVFAQENIDTALKNAKVSIKSETSKKNMTKIATSATQLNTTNNINLPTITVSTIDIKIQSTSGVISRILKPTGISFEKNLNTPTNGMLYITDELNNAVYYVNSYSTYGKIFTTQINKPYDIIWSYNGRVEVTGLDRLNDFTWAYGYSQPSFPILANVATGFADGNKLSTRFNSLKGIVNDTANGFTYVADYNNNKIRKIYSQPVTGTNANTVLCTTLAGNGNPAFADGSGTIASFNGPTGIDLDSRGNIIVADKGNNRIRIITPDGKVMTVAGTGATGSLNGPRGTATFNHPTDVAVDSGDNIYVADYDNNLIRKIDRSGNVTTYAGTGKPGNRDGVNIEAEFNKPLSLALDKDKNILYITDYQNFVVRKITVQ